MLSSAMKTDVLFKIGLARVNSRFSGSHWRGPRASFVTHGASQTPGGFVVLDCDRWLLRLLLRSVHPQLTIRDKKEPQRPQFGPRPLSVPRQLFRINCAAIGPAANDQAAA